MTTTACYTDQVVQDKLKIAPEMEVTDKWRWDAFTHLHAESDVKYIERAASLIQLAISQGISLKDAASDALCEAEPEKGVNFHTYTLAVSALMRYWVHGREFSDWMDTLRPDIY
jgi:hypothetical protein